MKKAVIVLFYLTVLFATTSCKDQVALMQDNTQNAVPVISNPNLRTVAELQQQLHSISDNESSSIVYIGTETTVTQQMVNPFDFFFRDPRRQNPEQREFKQEGLGSGIIYRRSNDKYYILTNNHVVDQADKITVKIAQDKIYEARLLGGDPEIDIAVLEITTNDELNIAQLGNSDNVRVGDFVVAIGNPFGLYGTMTFGIVSAIGRSDIMSDRISLTNFIQTDASINPGNSGGGLIDMEGRVIGINTLIYSQTGGSVGIGFAIPINIAKRIADQLVETGEIQHGYLGVQYEELTPSSIETLGLRNVQYGMIVKKLLEGGPAEQAGIRVGDVLIEFEGIPLRRSNDLVMNVANTAPDTRVRIKLVRDGNPQTVSVTLGRRSDMAAAEDSNGDNALEQYGIQLVELTDAYKQSNNIPRQINGALVANVVQGSPAAQTGIRKGFILTKINNNVIRNIAEVKRIIEERRNQRNYFFFYGDGKEFIIMM